ncbi:hypothetical protein AAHA92_15060 [Salvia divinorum]|uniref:Uncharacterized protein n=1 Tax=Salvia divinorum TaxID=28513 RepID=A0ABD1HG19_SALDI
MTDDGSSLVQETKDHNITLYLVCEGLEEGFRDFQSSAYRLSLLVRDFEAFGGAPARRSGIKLKEEQSSLRIGNRPYNPQKMPTVDTALALLKRSYL